MVANQATTRAIQLMHECTLSNGTLNTSVMVALMTHLSCIAVLACLGFLSPANRGALMTCSVVLWVLLGTPAGYVSARLYKSEYYSYCVTKCEAECHYIT